MFLFISFLFCVRTDQFFETTVRDADTHMICDRPRDNWLVFTAGCMGAGKTSERERAEREREKRQKKK